MLQIRGLLQQARQYGIALEERAHSLFEYSLLSGGVTLASHQLFIMIGLMYLGLMVMVTFLKTPRGQEKPARVAGTVETAGARPS